VIERVRDELGEHDEKPGICRGRDLQPAQQIVQERHDVDVFELLCREDNR
jgi:hypothetical protein